MEVKPGYKQTEIGLLPVEWDAGFIGQAVEGLEAGASVNSDKDGILDFDSYPCVLKTGAAKEGALNLREVKKVAQRDLWRLKVTLRKDTILVSRMNTVELVGESGYVDADYPNVFVPDRMWMATLRSTIYPRWFSYVLTWQPVKSRISSSATGTSGSMKNISKPSLRAVRIPYPPVDEQRAIATALSDVDGLLGGLDRLIAKKRDLKQAAMQQLLTGQTRLPGFAVKSGYKQTDVGMIPDDWEVKALAAIADKIMVGIASAATHAYRAKGIPMFRNQNIKVGRLDDGDLLFIAPEYEAMFKNKRLRGGDLLTMRTGYPGVTAIVPLRYESAQSFTTLITRPRQHEAESSYLCHYVNSEMGQRFFTQSQIGGAQKNVNAGTLRQMPVPLPTVPEQTAIAEVLTDMDAELAALEQRREKARALKQAMMQELLTGRTRLM